MRKSVEKVVAYITITREISGCIEVLVFEHRDIPDAGIQVPAGTVDLGEAIANAVLLVDREVVSASHRVA